MTTLREVAQAAGVSISTVSRVVNGYEHVSEELRWKVTRAIKELNYQPNLLAKALVSGKDTRQIGLLIYDVANMYFAEIAGAVENVAYKNGYSVILCNSSEGRNTAIYLQTFIQRQVDGVAIATGELEDNDIVCLERLLQRHIPVVISRERRWKCNSAMEYLADDIGIIELDYYTGARNATEYLISLGHKRIALLSSLPESELCKDPRIIGFKEILSEHNLEYNKSLTVTNLGFTQASGARGMLELLSRKQKFSAVIAYNDLLAIGAMAICREEGYEVPKDISILGFDNIEASKYSHPLLTTVDVPKSRQGEIMAKYLISQIKERHQPIQKRFPAELVVRRSTTSNNSVR